MSADVNDDTADATASMVSRREATWMAERMRTGARAVALKASDTRWMLILAAAFARRASASDPEPQK